MLLRINRVSRLDSAFSGLGITRRYSVAGNVAWLSFSDAEVFEALDGLLVHEALPALVLKGDTSHMFLGPRPKSNISGRIKNTFENSQIVFCSRGTSAGKQKDKTHKHTF